MYQVVLQLRSTVLTTANGFTPAWHFYILTQREKGIENSQSSFSNIDDAKKRLQKLV